MRSAILALAITVTAVAADISVVWRHEISSGATSLTIHLHSADGTVLAETCGSLLRSLDFRKLNGNGAGQCT
jgi:hypothetical protein